MKSPKMQHILFSVLLSTLLLLGGGCSKKPVLVPGSGPDDPSYEGGTSIES